MRGLHISRMISFGVGAATGSGDTSRQAMPERLCLADGDELMAGCVRHAVCRPKIRHCLVVVCRFSLKRTGGIGGILLRL